MAEFWTEPLDATRHRDFMADICPDGGARVDGPAGHRSVYFVRECGFTFQFQSIEQLDEVVRFFGVSVHPSSRLPNDTFEHWYQRWFERLPAGLTARPKAERILRALRRARRAFTS
jgi:hypothetical protein